MEQQNIRKLRLLIPPHYDAVIIRDPVNRRYFTGWNTSAGTLIAVRSGRVYFIVDGRYAEEVKASAGNIRVLEQKKLRLQLGELFYKEKIRTAAIERSLTVAESGRLAGMVPDAAITPSEELDWAISQLRSVKSPEEVGRIKEAQRLTDEAFSHILTVIREGVTEWDIMLELEFFMRKNGAEAVSFDTIALAGENTSKPHGKPSHREITRGDFVTMDFGATVDGYHSDMTRTVAVGAVAEDQRQVYELVKAAGEAAIRRVRPGVPCRDVDAAARDIIADGGYGAFFKHSTGHGVGMEIHEGPNLHSNAEEKLEEGNVVTVEPGVYLDGRFGVRIEDMLYVTGEGCENLTRSEKGLIIL